MSFPKYTEDELLAIAERALTGELTRIEVAKLPRPVLAYVGITMMLATRYRLNDSNTVQGSLADALHDLLLKGVDKEEFGKTPRPSHFPDEVRISAGKLGLYAPGARGGYRLLTLSPSPRLESLVAKHRESPAVRAFLHDMEIHHLFYEDWRQEKNKIWRREAMEEEADSLLRQYQAHYGSEGLELLQSKLSKLLEQ